MLKLRYRVCVGVAIIAFGVFAEKEKETKKNPLNTAIRVQPDPTNRSHLFGLLREPHIQEEIGMNEDQVRAVEMLTKKGKDTIRKIIEEGRKTGVRVNLSEAVAARKLETEDAIEEVLLPEQHQRLTQVAYRIEAQKLGLARAILQGRLSEEVGIHREQRSSFYREASQILKLAEADINDIKVRAEEEVLELLVPEQRDRARETIGDYFELEDREYVQSSSND